MNDELLVSRVCAGRLDLFETLIDRHLSHVRLFAAYHAPSSELVEDITRQTFVFALNNIHLFKTGTEFRAWLRAVALKFTRTAIEEARELQTDRFSQKRFDEFERISPNPYAGCEADFLDVCAQQLPESLRVLARMHYKEGKPTAKIADRLGRSLGSVRLGLFRLRQELAVKIQLKQREDADAQ